MRFSSELLRQHALEMGFNLIGVIRAEPSPMLNAYLKWIESGMQGEMGYLARPDRQIRRQDLNNILPGVRSMIVVGLDYHTGMIPQDVLKDPSRGRIASYAWGLDYHDLLTPRLEQFTDWLQQETRVVLSQRAYVDTGPILERSHAQQAGIGFVGKNTMLINPRRGSYFFLGEILTDLEFDSYNEPHSVTMCGSCTRCLKACPTNAFPKPYVLDARRCISYLTIEHKGWIDRELRPLMGNWIFGCDICQEVCPWQRFAPKTQERDFYPVNIDRSAPLLLDILNLDDESFSQRYKQTPIFRIKRERLVRNACIAAGNWGDSVCAPVLERLLSDSSPIIRGHAAWALIRILGEDSALLIKHALAEETDPQAREEMLYLIEEDL